MRLYIDYGRNERKARAIYNMLLLESNRRPELWEFVIEGKSWWTVYYITRR